MTIRAFIRGTATQEITDFLGGDPIIRGEERTGTYPGVEVLYYDDTAGTPDDEASHRGICSYFLRPGSALETMDDVLERVRAEIARITQAQEPPPPPSATAEAPGRAADLDRYIGADVTEDAKDWPTPPAARR